MFDTPPPNLPLADPMNPTPTPAANNASSLPPANPVAAGFAPPLVTPSMAPAPAVVPTPMRGEPEDPFAGVDPAAVAARVQTPNRAAPALPQSPAATSLNLPPEVFETTHHFPWRGLIIGLIVLIIVSGGAYAGYMYLGDSSATETASVATTETETITTPEVPVLTPPEPSPEIAPTADTDGDGLIDSEETGLGTDVNNPDTDGDGLFDGEEVKVFHTDPLKRDTDGDTFTDGEEVKNGFNPSGPGRLFNVPATPPQQ